MGSDEHYTSRHSNIWLTLMSHNESPIKSALILGGQFLFMGGYSLCTPPTQSDYPPKSFGWVPTKIHTPDFNVPTLCMSYAVVPALFTGVYLMLRMYNCTTSYRKSVGILVCTHQKLLGGQSFWVGTLHSFIHFGWVLFMYTATRDCTHKMTTHPNQNQGLIG